MLVLKATFVVCLIITLIIGLLMLKNFERWFGVDPQAPSDNESMTFLNKTQAVTIWVLAMKLCLLMIFIL
jgi:hypothetical protein